jgi:hypothetical protein
MGKLKDKIMLEMEELFVVTGYITDKGYRDTISQPITKDKANTLKKNLEYEMSIAAPKYKWVTTLQVEPQAIKKPNVTTITPSKTPWKKY